MCIRFKSKQAFTLVELLVVISIILIASSVIFIGSKGGDGTKLTSAQRIVSGIAQGARGQAILKNAQTRLIIYSEAEGNAELADKGLRFFGIVYRGQDQAPSDPADPPVQTWIAATQGTYLPEGIYFNPNGKQSGKTNPWSMDTMNIDYPRRTAKSGTSGDQYYYLEFESNGTLSSGFANGWLVLQAGSLKYTPGSDDDPSSYSIDFLEENKEMVRSALIFRRMGTTTRVDDPSKIDVSSTPAP